MLEAKAGTQLCLVLIVSCSSSDKVGIQSAAADSLLSISTTNYHRAIDQKERMSIPWNRATGSNETNEITLYFVPNLLLFIYVGDVVGRATLCLINCSRSLNLRLSLCDPWSCLLLILLYNYLCDRFCLSSDIEQDTRRWWTKYTSSEACRVVLYYC